MGLGYPSAENKRAEVTQDGPSTLMSKVGNLLEFVEEPESLEYLQSVHYWPER